MVKKEVEKIVDQFNERVLNEQERLYLPRLGGLFLYLDRSDHGRMGSICRLEYRGSMDKWKFSIYKYSKGSYDSEEWCFPGAGLVSLETVVHCATVPSKGIDLPTASVGTDRPGRVRA